MSSLKTIMLWLLYGCLIHILVLVLPVAADHGNLRSLQDISAEDDNVGSWVPADDDFDVYDDDAFFLSDVPNSTNATTTTVLSVNNTLLCGRSVCADAQVWGTTVAKAPTSAPTVEGTPPNNVCSNAINLGWSGVPMRGTTIGATPDTGLEFCGGVIRSGSVWYSVMGTGAKLATSTCFEATQQDTQIAVYSAQDGDGDDDNDCDRLVCVGGNDDVPGAACAIKPFASRVVWNSRPGVKYYLLVYGFRELGNFDINVQVVEY
jgi:hypothetical protein